MIADMGKIVFTAVRSDRTEIWIHIYYYPDSVIVEIYDNEEQVFLKEARRKNTAEMDKLISEVRDTMNLVCAILPIIRFRVGTEHVLVKYECDCGRNLFERLWKTIRYSLDTLYLDKLW
jgi:hypothetical protein